MATLMQTQFMKDIAEYVQTKPSIAEAARSLGLERTTLSHWMHGDRLPSWDMYFTTTLALSGTPGPLAPAAAPECIEQFTTYVRRVASVGDLPTVQQTFDLLETNGGSKDALTYIKGLCRAPPVNAPEHATRFVDLCDRLTALVETYRHAAPDERDTLRLCTGKKTRDYCNMLIEARQLLRTENNYQDYLKMNNMGGQP